MLFDEVNGYTPEYIYGNYFKRVPQGKIYVEKREENEESEKDDKSEKKMGNLGLSELSGLGDSGEQADTSSESQCWVSKVLYCVQNVKVLESTLKINTMDSLS
ncbi:hypothetical protein RHMOL_Rhmol02G0292100 [Rhododendron molle]|uniref:Uncharacterized protein n=1 Tax=Rhododendron molle TaxID=49168 RepID=A0ACC0PXX6_RHOML|nr:hypothetical protein RHMOL_Rhmol02G0292100 [Rhododendron molle]